MRGTVIVPVQRRRRKGDRRKEEDDKEKEEQEEEGRKRKRKRRERYQVFHRHLKPRKEVKGPRHSERVSHLSRSHSSKQHSEGACRVSLHRAEGRLALEGSLKDCQGVVPPASQWLILVVPNLGIFRAFWWELCDGHILSESL